MPTGYTADIAKGITFKEFALDCARAFGACVTMRDEPNDKPIPDAFEPSDWHKKELAKAKARLSKLNRMSAKEADFQAHNDWDAETENRNRHISENNDTISKYKDMLKQVKMWIPPTTEHTKFKEFMISQIEGSINHDDMSDYYKDNPPILHTGKEWLEIEKAKALRDIEYHTKENEAEIQRTNGRNDWIRNLRESLN